MCLFCIQQINFVMSLVANNKRVTVPPTFHPLPSLLNVIDFESESETDKTTHIRKRLPFRERQQLHAITDRTHTTHTHNVICAPTRNSNAPLIEVPGSDLLENQILHRRSGIISFMSPIHVCKVSSSSRDRKRPAGQVCVGEAFSKLAKYERDSDKWKMSTRNVAA